MGSYRYPSTTACSQSTHTLSTKPISTILLCQPQRPVPTARTLSSSYIIEFEDDAGDDDEEKYHNYDNTHRSDSLGQSEVTTVKVTSDGQQVSITVEEEEEKCGGAISFPTHCCWTLSAPLLWINDPQYIHPTCGQRLRTLGQYARSTAIANAELVTVSFNYIRHDNEEDIHLHPRPLPGSLHPRGGIYNLQNQSHHPYDTKHLDRQLLKLEWTDAQISYYDLSWLISHAKLGRIGQAENKPYNHSNTKEDMAQPLMKTKSISQTTFPSFHTSSNTTTTRVTKDIAIRAKSMDDVTQSIPTFSYTDVMEQDDATFQAFQGIYEHGAILIRHAPVQGRMMNDSNDIHPNEQEKVVANLGKKFSGGALSHGSLYGEIFHVQSKMGADNIAYTNVGLPPHQDLTYYESKPFLQLLHCVSSGSIVGGQSVLIDAMAAAEELRHLAPELFEMLCQTEATFLKEREGADMVSPKPHIVTDPTLGHVVEINWSPPFEGPLQIHPTVPVEDYVQAYQAMECLLNDQWEVSTKNNNKDSLIPNELEEKLKQYARNFTWEFALQPGDVLVFNNQRMLHGRREFTAVGVDGQRHLIGCYTDAMDTTSQYRQILRERGETGGGGYGRRNPGSGYRWM